jgi:hypothetical protein
LRVEPCALAAVSLNAIAPSRSPLVMLAFVPGWVSSSSRCRCRPHHARVVACPISCSFGPPCRAPPLWSAAVVEPLACARSRTCKIVHAITPPCTRACVHAPWETKAGLWLLFLVSATSPSCLPADQGRAFGFFSLCRPPHRPACRATVAFAMRVVVVHTWARGGSEAFRALRAPSPPTQPRTFVRHRRP